jgi:alpha-tubulin suppressor-like RCC1 family protein
LEIPADLDDVVAIAAGKYHSLALRIDGSIVAWGLDTDGQMTIPSHVSLPVMLTGSVDVRKAGNYTLTYSAKNALGATCTTTRTVVVSSALTNTAGTIAAPLGSTSQMAHASDRSTTVSDSSDLDCYSVNCEEGSTHKPRMDVNVTSHTSATTNHEVQANRLTA